MIKGVIVKKLTTRFDKSGFFCEVLRVSDVGPMGFGQLSHSFVKAGVVKAWHGHRYQRQWTYVVSGQLKVALYDGRENSPTYRETMELCIGVSIADFAYLFPPGVLHGYHCIADAEVIYLTSGVYDLADEIRLPPDDPAIGYDWGQS